MADDQLRILLTSKIDQSQKSISDLNNQINQLAAKLNKLDLKISIDEKFNSTLNNFINTFNQATQKTNDALANQVKIVNDETKAINNATEAQKKWNAEKQKVIKDGTGQAKSVTTTYGNNVNNNKQVVNTLPDGSIRQITDTSNMKKDLDDQIKLANQIADARIKAQERFEKLQESTQLKRIDSAHKEASEMNDLANQMADYRIKSQERVRSFEQAWSNNQQEQIQKNYQIDRDFLDKKDKDHALGLQQNLKREEDFQKQRTALETKVIDAQRRYKGDPNAGALSGVLSSVQGLDSSVKYKKNISDLDLELKKLTSTMSTAKSNSISFGEAFGTAMSRFPIWMAASTVFFQSLHFFTEGIKYVNDFNATLTQIGTAVNYNIEKQAQLAKSFQALGKEISATTADVSKGALEFYRQGLGDDEVIQRLKLTTQYAKISGLDFKQSAELLTAGSTSMHTDITKVADVFTLLGDKTATSKHMCSLAS